MGILSVLLAIFGYALGNVIIARKLGSIPTAMLVPMYCIGIAIVQLTAAKLFFGFGQGAHFAPGALWWLLGLIVAYTIADTQYVSALKSLSFSMVTTCVAIFPVAAKVIDKVFFGGTLPSARTMLGMALAVLTVWLVVADPANAPPGQ